ncbi:MAG: DUF4268 domain-containing protein [Candidatus Lokiarchaeota archaeon]|nr:DUF4268 domain-containing protein [Candidatus Lokiarchaeota archaeon]
MDRKKLRALLQWYRQEVGDDFVAVLVINRDGMGFDVLTKNPHKSIQETLLGNVSLLIDLILKKITREFTLGSFGVGTFDTEQYRYIFCEAGPEYVLVTVLNALAEVDPYFPYAYLAAEKVARIFDGRPVSPVIPKLHIGEKANVIKRKLNTLQQVRIHSELYAYKLVLGGDGGVGKTSMVYRFVDNVFKSDYKATIGTAITKKECQFEGLKSNVRFIIWDLAGQVQFRRVRQAYLADSEAGILVFDLTRRKTFENIKSWYKELKDNSPQDLFLILVGNKCDLELSREVTREEGEQLAQELGLTYLETSAKTGENINDAFRMLAIQLINRFVETESLEEYEEESWFRGDKENIKIIPNICDDQISFLEKSEKVDPIPLNKAWPKLDSDFTPWFEKNLASLENILNLKLNPVDKRQGTILARDEDSNRVLIETNYGKSNDKTLGQILTFVVKHDIKKVIWLCEDPLDEHINAVNGLNDKKTQDALYYLIQLKSSLHNNVPELKFNILCKPTIKEPEMIDIPEKEEPETQEDLKMEEETLEAKRARFWDYLINDLSDRFPEHSFLNPEKGSWALVQTAKEGLYFGYRIKERYSSIELLFDHANRLVNNDRFKQLKAKKDVIFPDSNDFEWDYDEIRSYQTVRYSIDGGLNDEDRWAEIRAKMINAMIILVNSLNPYLGGLSL